MKLPCCGCGKPTSRIYQNGYICFECFGPQGRGRRAKEKDVKDTQGKEYGPALAGMVMGCCVGNYIKFGVTRDEVLNLVGDMYDSIGETIRDAAREQDWATAREPGWAGAELERRKAALSSAIDHPDVNLVRRAVIKHAVDELLSTIDEIY